MRALDVHFQLMQRLPVRTIPAKPVPEEGPYHSTPQQTLALNARIKALKKSGLKNFEIAERLEVSRASISYHLNGKCSTAANAAKRR